jgi:ATP-binding cassette, subfamily B, bacterial PglK
MDMSPSSSSQYIRKFRYLLVGKEKEFIFLIFLFLFLSLLETVGIGLIGPFIGLAINPQAIHENTVLATLYQWGGFAAEREMILALGVAIVLILCSKAMLSFRIQTLIFQFGFGHQEVLRLRLISSYLRSPYIFHLTRNTANLVNMILTETGKFANQTLLPLLFLTSNSLVVLTLIVLLGITDSVATLAVFSGLGLASMILMQFRQQIASWGKEKAATELAIFKTVRHGLESFKDTRIIGCEDHFESQLALQAGRYRHIAASFCSFQSFPRYIVEILLVTFLISIVLFYLFSGYPAQKLTATLGIFGVASIRLIPASTAVMGALTTIKNNSYVVHDLYQDLKEVEAQTSFSAPLTTAPRKMTNARLANTPELSLANSGNRPIQFDREIELDRVTYQYPEASIPSLQDISFRIKKGESIAFIGRSGAGKTTLVDVILGLLTPQAGDIRIDGQSYSKNLRSWQQLIGYIPQSIFLMDDTIERNIAFGVADADIDDSQLQEAIRMAQLSELIDQLPKGLKTEVGERGVRLSGGQRQRIGIARALYHQREVLVLDEATAALDNETEYLVTEAIKSLGGVKTLIIIAHRLSTVEHCDRLYLMEKGRIIKSGLFHEVVTDNKYFAFSSDADSLESPSVV